MFAPSGGGNVVVAMSTGQYMSQTQQQRLQMVLAPQLRQSLALLQVPILELRTLVQEEMQQNPTLEEKVARDTPVEIEPGTGEPEKDKALDFKEEFEVLARLDDEWREYFHQNQAAHPYTAEDAARRQHFFDSLTQPESLQEHLRNQLIMAELAEEDRRVAEMLVGSINDDGYLVTPLEDLAQGTGFSLDRIKELLQVIQEFDPIGVGARDLKECLMLQLNRLGKGESTAAAIVRDHLDDLGARRYPQLAKALGITLEEAQEAARFVSTLEPRPGRLFSAESANYVLPEVSVQKSGGEYAIALDRDAVPHLFISRHYRQLMENPDTPADVKEYIRDKIRAGTFLIKSIYQRQQTIYRIAREIVEVQRDFLEHGVSHLKPLTMAEIAAKLGIHETTVSRAIANKYMQTPRGVYEMKYFFTPGFTTQDGQEVSNKTIKDSIAQFVAKEDPAAPLSDQAMVALLKEKGITVARRTIAKYRDELKILPSHLRRAT
ncbi:MAG TPA: RNA polymerase factor sigma-54 [Kiritimatiellia bacterium]|nr:RNA polymerase factor sigma-54 [Kiritimatiellia bacterium]HRZ12266.1 RNA polymerase factor sigma-54 [Kiritimatiellia bacterium]HSA17976.1 RNA polymerase factor sigma-54 [Kiritimatiellia bacterium]